mgnify:CR=1 FL=1
MTDTGKEIKFDEKNKPGISNLLTIHSALSGKSIPDLESEFSGKGYGDFKSAVAEVVTSYFEPVRKRAKELLADEGRSALSAIKIKDRTCCIFKLWST